MSVLAVMLVPAGILIGADRNVTVRREFDGGRGVTVEQVGQVTHPKVFEWPNGRAIMGYFGLGQVSDVPMHRWLYKFMGRHLEPESLREVAEALRDDLNAYVPSDDKGKEALIVHIAGFDEIEGELAPVVWFIRNTTGLDEYGYYEVGGTFECSEELRASPPPGRFQGLDADAIRANLIMFADRWEPFWFKQGSDLAVMNTLEAHLWVAMRTIVEHHTRRLHPFPTTLADWEQHLRLAILTFGAYFEVFYPPYEQLVGGGADIVRIPWPPRQRAA